MKEITSALMTLALFLFGIQNANAHAQVTSSVPAKNQTVKDLPSLVWIEFDGDLLSFGDKQINRLTITNAKKVRVDVGGPIVGGARISTRLKAGLPSGKYLVSYRVVSGDGHPVAGSFSFTYKPK